MSIERRDFWVAYELFRSMKRLEQACQGLQTVHGTLIAEDHDSAAVAGMVVDELIRIGEDIRKEIDAVDPGTLDALGGSGHQVRAGTTH